MPYNQCPLCPRKRTSFSTVAMSALCQKQICITKKAPRNLFSPLRFRPIPMCSGTVARAGVGDTPDRAARVISDQQRAILGDCKRGRAPPHFCALLTGYPEAGGEILIEAFRSAIFERHAHNLVASRLRPVPGTFKSDESITFVFGRELVAFIEDKIEY